MCRLLRTILVLSGDDVTNEYPIVVLWSDENDAFIADVPDLPYCSAHGDTPETALGDVRIAMQAWLDTACELGKPIPHATPSAQLLQRAS
jgi:predicted RNase H-like HicB family nuclease